MLKHASIFAARFAVGSFGSYIRFYYYYYYYYYFVHLRKKFVAISQKCFHLAVAGL
jgi:hypothetical protein